MYHMQTAQWAIKFLSAASVQNESTFGDLHSQMTENASKG